MADGSGSDGWQSALLCLQEGLRQKTRVDVISYNRTITSTDKASQWQHARCLVHDLRRHNLQPSIVTHCAAMAACSQVAEGWQQAADILRTAQREMVEVNTFACSSIIKVVSEIAPVAAWYQAMQTLWDSWVGSIEVNLVTFNAALNACAKSQRWQEAVDLLGALQRSLEPDIISFNASSRAATLGAWAQALRSFEGSRSFGLRSTVISFNSLISFEENTWPRSLCLLDEIQKLFLQPSLITVNSLLSACEKASEWQLALQLLTSMLPGPPLEKHGRTPWPLPDVISFNSAISACEKAGAWQQALLLMQDLDEMQLKKDAISFAAAVSACEKAAQWQQAVRLVAEAAESKVGPNLIMYSGLISALENSSQWQWAIYLLQALPCLRFPPDVIAFNAAISSCEKMGRWQQALQLLQQMPFCRLGAGVISGNAAISGCEKAAQWRWAKDLLYTMLEDPSVEPNIISFNASISATEKASQWHHALGLHRDAKSHGLLPDAISYNASMSAVGAGRRWQFAFHLYAALDMLQPQLVSFNAIFNALERNSALWRVPLWFLQQMNGEEVQPDMITLESSINVCEDAEKGSHLASLLNLVERSWP